MHIYTSTGMTVRYSGADQFTLGDPVPVTIDRNQHTPMWIEATWLDDDGTMYAWYHHEPQGLCGTKRLTAPKIGALVSYNGGLSFTDLGIVMESWVNPDCNSQNGYFAGGHGDFSVILDRDRRYFYFLFDNYGGALANQGVAIARMAFEQRRNPVGTVWKYHEGGWAQPGLGGLMTPIFPTRVDWMRPDTDSYWGPSIHYNTFLEQYVILLNRSCCAPGWPGEGIYISFNADLENPAGWLAPEKISSDVGWYPQVIGIQPGESDKLAGEVARLYISGVSWWDIVFKKAAEAPPAGAPPIEIPPIEAPPIEAPPIDIPPIEAPPGEQAPPIEAPPAEAPPAEIPPGEVPPAEAPPAEAPLAEAPPVEAPPVEAPPVEAPPVEAPPVEAPPVEAPPAEIPPGEAPPAEAPPAEAPPVEASPAEVPPAEAPSTEAQPAEVPPVVEPPTQEAPPQEIQPSEPAPEGGQPNDGGELPREPTEQ